MLNIYHLYTLNKEDINPLLNIHSKEDLIFFAKLHEIPVKKYHSKPKIVEHLSIIIASAGMYRRIAGTDTKRSQ